MVYDAKSFLKAASLSVMVLGMVGLAPAAEAKTHKITVKAGTETVIQQMYWINRRTCVPDEVPPQPNVRSKPKFGTLRVHLEPATTRQCPDKKANSLFLLYRAGNTAGTDKVKVNWKPTSDSSFSTTYVITIE